MMLSSIIGKFYQILNLIITNILICSYLLRNFLKKWHICNYKNNLNTIQIQKMKWPTPKITPSRQLMFTILLLTFFVSKTIGFSTCQVCNICPNQLFEAPAKLCCTISPFIVQFIILSSITTLCCTNMPFHSRCQIHYLIHHHCYSMKFIT